MEEDTKPEEQTPSVTQADLDNLRSVKDKEIASLSETIRELQEQVNRLQTPQEAAALLGDLQEAEAALEDDPKGAFAKAKATAARLAAAVIQEQRRRVFVDQVARDWAATAEALKLASEFGGDYQLYKQELLKAKTQPELQLLAKEKALELREKSAAGKSKPTREVDEGGGSSGPNARMKIREKLASFDVTTPEGAKKFLEAAPTLKKELEAAR